MVLTVVPTPDTVRFMHTIHYDNGVGLPACGIIERAPRLTRNPDHIGCYHCEFYVPPTSPYQLPSGRIVEIRTDVARGAETIDGMFDGAAVVATRYEARR